MNNPSEMIQAIIGHLEAAKMLMAKDPDLQGDIGNIDLALSSVKKMEATHPAKEIPWEADPRTMRILKEKGLVPKLPHPQFQG